MARAGLGSTVRAEILGIGHDPADSLSLFVVVQPRPRSHRQGRPLLDEQPFLDTMGFAANWSAALTGQPRRFAKIDVHTIDRFVAFETGSRGRSLATVSIREVYAYDLSYRSEVGATGLAVRVGLHSQAIGPIVDFLQMQPGLDHGPESRAICVFRFPVRHPIRFPEPRGAENPYAGSGEELGPLRDIATVRVRSLEVAVKIRPSSPAIEWDAQSVGRVVGASAILRLSL